MEKQKITILQDSQEKNPWNFTMFDKCHAQERKHLETGDYTVVGYEKKLAIERKSSTGELSQNLGMDWKRFRSELERMAEYEHKYIICEFSIDTLMRFPVDSTIPRSFWRKLRMNGKFMYRRLIEACENNGIIIIFAGSKEAAEQKAFDIICKVVNDE